MTETHSPQPPTQNTAITGTSAFTALAAAAFVSGANLRIFDALLPKVADDFKVLPTTAAVVITAFTLAYGLFQIVYGPVGDRFGKLRVVAAAALMAAVTSLLAAFAPSLRSLAMLRFATGVGAAAIVPLSLAWIGDTTGYDTRQATIGRFVGFLLMGQVLGPAFGGLLAQVLSWREVFYAMALVFLIVGVVLVREALKSSVPAAAPGSRPGIIQGYLAVLSDPWVRVILAIVFIEGALFFGAFAYVGVLLKTRFSLSYAMTGALLACYGIGGFLYSLLVRRLLARMNEVQFVKIGGFVLLACFGVLPWIPAWPAAIPLLVTTGFGFYMLHNTLQTRATEMAPRARGTGIAVFALCLFIGQAAGVTAIGRLIRTAGYGTAYAAAGALLLILSRVFARLLAKR